MTGPQRDAGRVSLFLAVALAGVLVVVGLAFDGAGRLRTMQRADNLAAEAARAGGQAIDLAAAIGGEKVKVVDEAAAQAAVANYFSGMSDVDWTVSFPPGGQQVTVVVEMSYDTAMLDVFGFADTIPVRGRATAVLLTEG
jgi:hypothetical protein